MTRPVMQTDLQPLCPRHYTTMVFGTVKMKSSLQAFTAFPLYACEEQFCSSRYDMERGYFAIGIGEEIRRNGPATHRCPHDGYFMYICSIDPQTRVRVWKCSAEICSGSRMERYAAA